MLRKFPSSVVIHVLTKKGKGYKYTENDIEGKWHGVGPFNRETGEEITKQPVNMVSWSQLTSEIVYEIGKENQDIVYITPAMINGSAMNKIFAQYPERSFDVGIAEEHAVTLASGLALNNKRPYIAIYATFLQRAYDQINHDISRMNLPVVFTVDRSGVVGGDGETHQGIFDVGILRHLPNVVISMPKDAIDACMVYKTAFKAKQPFFIRIPRDNVVNEYNLAVINDERVGKWDYHVKENSKVNLIVTGPYFNKVKDLIYSNNIPANLIFARYYKPLDENVLNSISESSLKTIVIDLYCDEFGLYEVVANYYDKNKKHVNLIRLHYQIPLFKLGNYLIYLRII